LSNVTGSIIYSFIVINVIMKKTTFVITALLLSIFGFGQDVGSGTIIFNTSTNFDIEATATDLFDGGTNVYDISGTTNQSIAFGPWAVPAALGSDEVLFTNNVLLPKNPNGALNLFIKANDANQVDVKVYDLNGRLVSSPAVIKNDNGLLQYYDALPSVSDGLYLVKVNAIAFNDSFKFIKQGEASSPIVQNVKYSKSSKGSKTSKTLAPNNYKITWNNTAYGYYGGTKEVEVLQGSSNTISIDPTPVTGTENGDFGILPLTNIGNPQQNTKVTVTNTIVPDSTYTVTPVYGDAMAIFYDAYVSNSNNPTSYKIDITGTEADPDFLPTTAYLDIYQDTNGEVNGGKTIEVTPIPNQQDITVKTINTITTNPEPNVLVHMHDATTSAVISSITSDANGIATFLSVAGQTDIYFSVEGTATSTDIYKTSRGTYSVPLVDRISEMTKLLYYSVSEKPQYENGDIIPGDVVFSYKSTTYNVEALRGSDELVFSPNSAATPIQIQHLKNLENTLGMKLFEYVISTSYSSPTPEQINAYQAVGPNKNYLDGIIQSWVTPSGTNTTTQGKVMADGIYADYYSSVFAMGDNDESLNHHEAIRRLNINSRGGASVTNSNAAENIPLGTDEARCILYPLQDGYNYYVGEDANGIPLNYGLLTSLAD
jgi:hypothetical protein